MGPVGIILIVAAVVLLGGLAAMLAVTIPIGKKVYHDNLVRTSPDKWGRACSFPDNEEQVQMWCCCCGRSGYGLVSAVHHRFPGSAARTGFRASGNIPGRHQLAADSSAGYR